MEYKEFFDEVASTGDMDLLSLAAAVGIGGSVLPKYADALEAASSVQDFYDAVYSDDSLIGDFVWGAVASMQHAGEWIARFAPAHVEHALSVEGGKVVFETQDDAGEAIEVAVPDGAQTVDVLVFDDGVVPENALKPLVVDKGAYRIGGYEFSGQFGIHTDSVSIVLVLWEIGPDGFRVSDANKVCLSCA